ncbi:MAG: hypothetical protein ACP5G1_04245 [Nanopusillaceae archaeon]
MIEIINGRIPGNPDKVVYIGVLKQEDVAKVDSECIYVKTDIGRLRCIDPNFVRDLGFHALAPNYDSQFEVLSYNIYRKNGILHGEVKLSDGKREIIIGRSPNESFRYLENNNKRIDIKFGNPIGGYIKISR